MRSSRLTVAAMLVIGLGCLPATASGDAGLAAVSSPVRSIDLRRDPALIAGITRYRGLASPVGYDDDDDEGSGGDDDTGDGDGDGAGDDDGGAGEGEAEGEARPAARGLLVADPPDRAPSREAGPTGRPKVVAVVLVGEGDELEERAADEVRAGIASALDTDIRITYREIEDFFDPADAADGSLAEADAHLEAAGQAFDEMDLEKARNEVLEAIRRYQRYLPRLTGKEDGMTRLRNAWIRLASIRFFDGDMDGARNALRYVFVYDPAVEYSPKLFPPQMKKLVVEGKLLIDAFGAGQVRVTSDPPGARVYLNGTEMGRAPLRINDAVPGPNLLTLRRAGFMRTSAEIEVAGSDEVARADVRLEPYPGDPMRLIERSRKELGAADAPRSLMSAAESIGADIIVPFVMTRKGSKVELAAFVYDQRPRQLLREGTNSGPDDQIGDTARALATDLFKKVRLDGSKGKVERSGPSAGRRMSEGWSNFRRSKAFWPVVGVVGGVLVAGAAVGLGVGLGTQSTFTKLGPVVFY